MSNLPDGITSQDIRKVFETYGPIRLVTIPLDNHTRRIRGFAFIEYHQHEHAQTAQQNLHRAEFYGRNLYVEFSDKNKQISPTKRNLEQSLQLYEENRKVRNTSETENYSASTSSIHKRDRPAGPDESDRSDRSDRPDGPDRFDRYDIPERSKRNGRPERPERPDRTDRTDISNRHDIPKRVDRLDKSVRHDIPDKQDRSLRDDRTDRSERSDRPNRSYNPADSHLMFTGNRDNDNDTLHLLHREESAISFNTFLHRAEESASNVESNFSALRSKDSSSKRTNERFESSPTKRSQSSVQLPKDHVLYVCNFPDGTTSQELRTVFETYGPVISVMNPPKMGFAFVHYVHYRHALNARQNLDRAEFHGRILNVEFSDEFWERLSAKRNSEQSSQVHEESSTSRNTSETENCRASTSSMHSFDRPNRPTVTRPDGPERINRTDKSDTYDLSCNPVHSQLDNDNDYDTPQLPGKEEPDSSSTTFVHQTGESASNVESNFSALMRNKDSSSKQTNEKSGPSADNMSQSQVTLNNVLFVSNFPDGTTSQDLREVFEAYGPLRHINIPVDNDSKTPRGFAYVHYEECRHAQNAQHHLNRKMFHGKNLNVSFSNQN